jgi:FtsZ-binding cell division protein ZapB
MMNSKLQSAIDEVERLCDTVKEYKKRNGHLPQTDSDAGRAVYSLQLFSDALKKFDVDNLLDR